jgi:hypothetical protein
MKRLITIFTFLLFFQSGFGSDPHLSFFCELKGKEFNELFADTALIRELVEMKISVRIGLHDFSPERTRTIQKLNQAGIPLFAWLLLPEEEGYWFNVKNGDKARKRYDDFTKWTIENNLKWDGIGIDIEPDMNDAKMALSHPWKLAWKVYKRLYDNESLKKGKEQYQSLIGKMKADGYPVESYIIPYIFEERAKKTTSLQKLMGIVDIETDTEIPMLYTSMLGNPGIIPLYHRDNMPVALGSTGGGVDIGGIDMISLSWDNLKRDLLIASKLTDQIHIFCLETTVQKGFLTDIRNFDFTQEAQDITTDLAKQKKIGGIVRFILVVLDHPFWLTVTVIAIIGCFLFGVYKLSGYVLKIFSAKK